MPTTSMGDYDLHYQAHIIDRRRPTLFFIHSLSSDASEWSLLVNALSTRLNYVCYDWYGHGSTGTGDAAVTFELLVSEVMTLIRTLDLEPVHLVGSGFGASVASIIGQRCPDRVASLTLISSVFYLPEDEYETMYFLQKQLITIDRELLIHKLMMEYFHPVNAEKSRLFHAMFTRIRPEVFRDSIDLLLNTFGRKHFCFTDELKKLQIPTLILHGSDHPVFPAPMAAIYAACITNSRWFILPEAGHLIALDQPEQAAKHIEHFVTSEKVPIPVSPFYRNLVDRFRSVIQRGFSQDESRRPVLRMNIMHHLEVLWNGHPIEGKWNQRGAKEILLYLILNHGVVRRGDLVDVFLQDLPSGQARNNLRVRLNHLNQIFHNCLDPEARDILLIGEETVVCNAQLASDIGEYIDQLDRILSGGLPLGEASRMFVALLKDYDPADFSTFRGDWIFTLTDAIEEKLSEIMKMLLPLLKKRRMLAPVREILQAGRAIEPYDGYCDEKLAELQNAQ